MATQPPYRAPTESNTTNQIGLRQEKKNLEEWSTRVGHIEEAQEDIASAGERLEEIQGLMGEVHPVCETSCKFCKHIEICFANYEY